MVSIQVFTHDKESESSHKSWCVLQGVVATRDLQGRDKSLKDIVKMLPSLEVNLVYNYAQPTESQINCRATGAAKIHFQNCVDGYQDFYREQREKVRE